jgi:Asp/Glu/hydantoin racemase
MSRTLAIIHTGAFLAPVFTNLCKEIMPDVKVFNIVDESLINSTIAANQLTASTSRRLARYLESAEEAGADAILVTCSSVGPAVEAARPFVNVPVLRVDQPMADEAVGIGRRIGVIATLPTTLEPTVNLIKARAAAQGREVEIVAHLCEQAFQALTSGDTETHDRIVAAGLKELMDKVDVVVLAQASMARVADTIPEAEKRVPVLSSPRFGVEAAKKTLAEMP